MPTIIFLLLILTGIYLYISKVELTSPTPVQQVVQDSESTIWALFGDTLIDISDQKPNRSFSQHGFDHHVGQVVPLDSGEWILNVGAQSDYVKKAILRTKLGDKSEYQAGGSLLMCSSDLSRCEPWGETELQFDRAFEGVQLDDGRFLIFKAEQKRIFLVSAEGLILSEVDGQELWFGANLTSNGSWVGLNTNRNKLTEISVQGDSLRADQFPLDFRNISGDVNKIISPSKVVEYSGAFWLLSFMRSNEGDSTIKQVNQLVDMVPSLLKVDYETKQATKFPYDFRAEAEIERIDNAIYFTDFDKHEIKQFDLISETMSLVNSSNLRAAFNSDQERVDREKAGLYKSLIVTGLAALFAFGWILFNLKPAGAEVSLADINADLVNYDASKSGIDREFEHVVSVFAKRKLSKTELAAVIHFKKINGNYVYYPNGVMSKGKLVPDSSTLVALYKWGEKNYQSKLKWLTFSQTLIVLSLALVGISKPIAGVGLVIGLIALVIGIIINLTHLNRRRGLIKDLLTHSSRFTYSDLISQLAKGTSYLTGWVLIVCGTLPLVSTLYFYTVSSNPDSFVKLILLTTPIALMMVIFGLLLLVAQRKLQKTS